MSGTCVGGAIFNKLRRTFVLAGANVLLAVATLVIPWCSLYWLMLVAFSMFGLSLGVINSVTGGDLQGTWGRDGRLYTQGMLLMYAIGAALAPLIAAPFLSPAVHSDFRSNKSDIDLCVNRSNEPIVLPKFACFDSVLYNISRNVSKPTDQPTRAKSQLYLSYMFTTVLSALACLAFIAFYIQFERQTQMAKNELRVSKEFETRTLPRSLKCLALGSLVCVSGLICCIDDTFFGFLTTFCVNYLKWTKSQGTLLTSVSSTIVVVGRIWSVVVIQFISPMTLVGFHCLITMLSFVGLYASAVNLSNVGVFIAAIGFGFGKSAILPSVLSWIEEIVSPVSGKISALVFFVITALTAINPVIMGHMMETFSGILFVLVLLGESSFLLLVYTSAVLLSKFIVARYGYTYSKRKERLDDTL
ncbi:Sodium-dependent glucose transporter 1A [Mizuhopecten yessoensis]|uniref:Sodium-dependent glucose transporter 1A n=2 Tax=Mizuhopecten yessoensis TaxID=6573 RepID=A0A210PDI5_MIZYE|nr:Sodium-dependent glucose transporter 1A [Mizuhopecten yessoensis]